MKKLFPFLLALILLFSACGKSTTEDYSPEPPAVSAPDSTPEPTPVQITNPLTGEPIDEDISNLRPYAVMLNNIKVALPQCGISKADILYEVLAEGDITRFEAIFSDINGVGTIGSMRSSRPYYIDIALSYNAVYVHAGGSEQAYSDISSKKVDNIDGVRGAYAESTFYRDSSRQKYGTEHSMFTNSEKILQCMDKLGYETNHSGSFDYGLIFTEEVDMGDYAENAQSVNVSFGGLKNTSFTYHSDTGHYTGFQYGTDLIDGSTNEVVKFKNLLVLYSDSKILDSEGRRAFELTGTGSGHFICNGKAVNIKWRHSGAGNPFTYEFEDGTPLELGIGKTYIAIVPTNSTITIQ